ncbi:glycosyltransferase family 4 protein [Marinicella rhabdoformis]|uniref:glycosyltransferase family 4 protein n=1 Tax=Marinicella rhabdoformis TaxID=2580566 RepID=UPI0012AECA23|nr:glycosyltransferase family 1 protein [Marinicella rhabdoformis]
MNKPKILVDGFNLNLKKGSGIKTYGITLLDAYSSMDNQVDVLLDNEFTTGKNVILDEVNLFDQDEIRPKSKFKFQLLNNIKALSYLIRKRSGHLIKPQVTEPDPMNYLSQVSGSRYQYIENIPDVFHSANRLFAVTKKVTSLKLKQKPDIFHLTTPWPVKVPGVKTVVTIHDLIPLKVPFTTLDMKNHFYHLFKWAAESADMIFSVSEHTKKDIMEIYGIPEEKIQVTYQSYKKSDVVTTEEDDSIYLKAKKLAAQKYVLFVGNIEPKKNIKALIQAMAYIPKGYKLAVVGRKAWMHESQLSDLTRYLKKKEYVFLDYVSEEELSMLYKNALCMVFPSLYEGFGLPVLEAMAHDCPVICSNVSSLPEVGGDAALYVNPYKFTEIRDKLKEVISNEELRRGMIEKGRDRVSFFSPENYVKRLNQAYEKLYSKS